MYLKTVYCKKLGPIDSCAITAGFTSDGCPKPIVLVGRNGAGKSIVLSNVVDALHEMGCIAFEDVAKEAPGGGHKMFKISSSRQIKLGARHLLGYVSFTDEGGEILEYLYSRGQVTNEELRNEFEKLNLCAPLITLQADDKIVTNNKSLIEKSFQSSVLCYFPAYRFAIPDWIGRDYIGERNKDPYHRHYSRNLDRPLIIENAHYDTPMWLEDVVVDSKVDLERDGDGLRTTSNVNNAFALKKALSNVNEIISGVLGRNVELKLGYRNQRESRLAICEQGSSKAITPSLDALSTGQTVLLDLFATVLRYADAININQSINLGDIRGIVVVDEIDAHMHIEMLYDALPQVMRLFPKVQFVVTAHSPMFILGMEKHYGARNFDLYELPSGNRIEAESYNEFLVAMERMEATKVAQSRLQKQIEEATLKIHQESGTSAETVVITEGFSDWKHLERAWAELKSFYPELAGKIKFLHYHPKGKGDGEPEFEMGDTQLVEMCKQFSKIKQKSRFVFVADADNPRVTKDLTCEGGTYKNWGNNVYSFQLPDPGLRAGFSAICIEHYYSDEDLKTFVEIAGAKRRLFLSDEFSLTNGKTRDREYFYRNFTGLKSNKPYAIIEDCVYKDADDSSRPINYALPKNDFATEIMKRNPAFASLRFDSFKKVFDVLRLIVAE